MGVPEGGVPARGAMAEVVDLDSDSEGSEPELLLAQGRKRPRARPGPAAGPVAASEVVDLDASSPQRNTSGSGVGSGSGSGRRGGAGGAATVEVLEVGGDGGVRSVRVAERLGRCLACAQEAPLRLGHELGRCQHWICQGCTGALARRILGRCAEPARAGSPGGGQGDAAAGAPSSLELTLGELSCPVDGCERGLSHLDALCVLGFHSSVAHSFHQAILRHALAHFAPPRGCPRCGAESGELKPGDTFGKMTAVDAKALRQKHGLLKSGRVVGKGSLLAWCTGCGLAACAACGRWVPPREPGQPMPPPHRCSGSRLEMCGALLSTAAAARFHTDPHSGLGMMQATRDLAPPQGGGDRAGGGPAPQRGHQLGGGIGYLPVNTGTMKEDVRRRHQAQKHAAKSQSEGDKAVARALGQLEAFLRPAPGEEAHRLMKAASSAEGVRVPLPVFLPCQSPLHPIPPFPHALPPARFSFPPSSY